MNSQASADVGGGGRTRVLILCNHAPGLAPGHRFRFEQYLGILNEAGIEVTQEPFFDPATWPILYDPGHTLRKMKAVLDGFAGRLRVLTRVKDYDYVFIHREAAPLGPPVVEWMLFNRGCKVVYDIDDAIYMSRTSKANWIASPLRWRSKIAYLTRRSMRVAACNPFLVDWAARFNGDVVLLPTTIDPEYHRRSTPRAAGSLPVIGWTGTRSNLAYLDLVIPALTKLQETHEFEFRVICEVPVTYPAIKHFRFVPWRLKTEIEDLERFDVGLMPVPDGPWEMGKVGFKAIQYSALETVPVTSDVGSGREVVIDGETGFVVKNDDTEWHRALAWLLDHPDTWPTLGAAARRHVLQRYSTVAQAQTYVGLFR